MYLIELFRVASTSHTPPSLRCGASACTSLEAMDRIIVSRPILDCWQAVPRSTEDVQHRVIHEFVLVLRERTAELHNAGLEVLEIYREFGKYIVLEHALCSQQMPLVASGVAGLVFVGVKCPYALYGGMEVRACGVTGPRIADANVD